LKKKDKERIMSQNEVLELLTKHARGQTKEECLNVVGIGDHCSEVVKTEKQISTKDQIKALELIAKRFIDKEKFRLDRSKFEHTKKIDNKKIELEEKKLNTDTKNEDQQKNIDYFVDKLLGKKEELNNSNE
jgi:hypothetical protein